MQYVCEKCEHQCTEPIPATDQVRILFIANSFGQDSAAYLWHVLTSAGLKNVIVAVAYVGGCTLDRHWEFIENDSPEYVYEKNTKGIINYYPNTTLQQIVEDEPWDIISIQQNGAYHYSYTTFGHLDDIIDWVNAHKTNPKAKFVYNMVWTYSSKATDWNFVNCLDGDCDRMYSAITGSVRKVIVGHPAFDRIIPSGTVIQNLRYSSFTEESLYRDELHLSNTYGRYAVALGWYCALLDGRPEDIKWVPTTLLGKFEALELIHEAINNALEKPYRVTPCATQG